MMYADGKQVFIIYTLASTTRRLALCRTPLPRYANERLQLMEKKIFK